MFKVESSKLKVERERTVEGEKTVESSKLKVEG